MFRSAAEERLAKKIGLERDYHIATERQRQQVLPQRELPAKPGTLSSPGLPSSSPTECEWDFDTPHSSPSTPGSFTSNPDLIRIPTNESCDSADFFPVRVPGGPGDLMNRIHPIFRRRNAHGEAKRRYNFLRPSLQLASKFIQTESMLPFWYVLLFGETARIEKPWHSHDPASFEFLEAPETLTHAQIQKTKHALEKLAKRIRFTIIAGAPENGPHSQSYTHPRRKNGDARIFLSRAYLRDYRDAMKHKDHDRYLWNTFRIARTLCHELAHAVVQLVRGPGHFYFPGAQACEDGFEWEQQALGGITGVMESEGPLIHDGRRAPLRVYLWRWPNPHTVGTYLSDRSCIGVRERWSEDDVAHVEISGVPLECIARLFSARFWEEEVEVRGPAATRFPFIECGLKSETPEVLREALLGRKGLRLQRQKRKAVLFVGVDLGLRRASVGGVFVKRRRRHSTGALRVRTRMRASRTRVTVGIHV